MNCAFCGETDDVAACDFPILDFVPSTYSKLHAGDKVHRINEVVVRPAATVVSLEPCGPYNEGWSPAFLEMYMRDGQGTAMVTLRKPNGQEIIRKVYAGSPVRVLRDKNCAAPACWRHRCERGPGATFCASHWRLPPPDSIAHSDDGLAGGSTPGTSLDPGKDSSHSQE